jgi:hypothetical protein
MACLFPWPYEIPVKKDTKMRQCLFFISNAFWKHEVSQMIEEE